MSIKKAEKHEMQGRKFEEEGKFKKSIEKYQKAIEIIDKHVALYPEEKIRKAILYARMGYCYKNLNLTSNMNSAFQIAAKEAEEIATSNPNLLERAIIYHVLANSSKDTINQLLERALEMYKDENNVEKTVDVLLRLERIPDAVSLLIEAEKQSEESGDYKEAAKYLDMIAKCYIFMEDYVSAAEAYEKTYELITRAGEKNYETLEQICKIASKCYFHADMKEKAKFILLNSIMLYKEEMEDYLAKNRTALAAKALIKAAKTYMELNEEERFRETWQKGINLYIQALNEEKDLYKKSFLAFMIAKNLETGEKIDEALNYYEMGFEYYFKAIKRVKIEEIEMEELKIIAEHLNKLEEKKKKKYLKKVEALLSQKWKKMQKAKNLNSKLASDICILADCLELLGRQKDARNLYISGARIYERLLSDYDVSHLCDDANLMAIDASLARHLIRAIMNYLSSKHFTGELLGKLGKLLSLSENLPLHIKDIKFLDMLRRIIVAIRLEDKEQIKNIKALLDGPLANLLEASKIEINRLNTLLDFLATAIH
ncbi:MAG: hypothetical protein ACTSXW_04610 [Candidatus Baldrarchaeia archaeon]